MSSVNPTDTGGAGSGTSGVGGPSVGGTGTTGIMPNAIVTSQARTPWVKSQSVVVDAMRIGVETQPHGIDFTIMVPYQQWVLQGAALIAEPIAFSIETLLDIPAADDAWFVEDAAANGTLSGFIEFLVSVSPTNPAASGPFTSTVLIPIGQVSDYTAVQQKLQAAQALLTQYGG